MKAFIKLHKNKINTHFQASFSTKNLEITPNKYYFIKENSKLEELEYKEELFEFISHNYVKFSENDYKYAFRKLSNFQVLSSDITNIKCILRDFLEIKDNFSDELLLKEFIKFYNKKIIEIKQCFKENALISDEIENDIGYLSQSVLNLIESHSKYVKDNKNLLHLFSNLNTDEITDDIFSNNIWNKLIESFRINEVYYKSIISKDDMTPIINDLLFTLLKNKFSDTNYAFYLLNNFILKLKCYNIKSEHNYIKEEILDKYEQIYLLTNDLIEKSTYEELKQILIVINQTIKNLLEENKRDTHKIQKIYSIEQKEFDYYKTKLNEEYSDKLKILDEIRKKLF